MLLLGFIDADAATLCCVLRKPGRAVMLAVGGAEEALLARPGMHDLILNKRSVGWPAPSSAEFPVFHAS
jgi:hypothetical protein